MRGFAFIPLCLLAACKEHRPRERVQPRPIIEVSAGAPTVSPTPILSPTLASAVKGWKSNTTIATGDAHATSVAIDSAGNVIAAIEFSGKVTIGTYTFTTTEGNDGSLLAMIAPDGSIGWVLRLDVPPLTVSDVHVALDSHDAIVVAASSKADVLVAKYAPDSKQVWTHTYGGPDPDRPANIVVTAKDQIVVAGYYEGTVDFGGKKLTTKVGAGMFVARYTDDGKLVTANQLYGGGEQMSELYDVAVDPSGNAIAIGGFSEKLDLGGSTLTGTRGVPQQTFIAAFTRAGRVAWSTAYGTGPSTLMNHIAIDSQGRIALSGERMNIKPDENNMTSFDLPSGAPSEGAMVMAIDGLGVDHEPTFSLPISKGGLGDQVETAFGENDEILVVGDAASAPFDSSDLAGVRHYFARLSPTGSLRSAYAVPDAAPIACYQKVAARGSNIVVLATTVDGEHNALVLLRPE